MSEASKTQSSAAATSTTEAKATSLLDEILDGELAVSVDRPRGEQMLKALIDEALKGTLTWDKSVTRTINEAVKQLDKTVSKQLAAVMHAPEFQKLEGSWRGLKHLVFNSETSTTLKIKVMNVTKRDVFKDLDKAVEFDQSIIWKKMYEDEFGMPGGAPFGAMIGDFEFSNHPEDVDMLQKMSGVAAGAMCPFISAAAPKLMGLDTWTDLNKPRDLARIFDSVEYAKWKAFRESEDSRYVGLVMPRVLSRSPYGKNDTTVEAFDYEEFGEYVGGEVPHDSYCWMNAAYAYGTCLTSAFAKTNWCTAIRGKENGGVVEGLPVHLFKNEAGDKKMKCPTEVLIPDRRDAELSKLGMMAICNYKDTDYSVFISGQTVQKPKVYKSPRESDNAQISARMPYIFAASRISHYLKMIARDKIGSFMERSDCEAWLNEWISQYVLADKDAKADKKARFPLAEAKITVTAIPGKPGAYNAQALLRPWLQMEELNAAMSMVAEIPSK